MSRECNSLSYDAMTTHNAVVFTRYMMLSLESRESNDNRSLGELFLYFSDEMLSRLPHHGIIFLFQNDSYLPYYRKYIREEIYMGWHDAAFQSKNYDTETYKKVQNNSYKIARRSIILLQVGVGFLIPFALTIVMGVIYAAATFQILDPTEYLSELLYSMGFTFVLCFVPLFWGAIAYARLQIVCQHLGFWLKGAVELSDRGRSVNLGRSVAHAVGAETAEAAYAVETAGFAMESVNICNQYLRDNGQKPISVNIFKITVFVASIVIIAVYVAAIVSAYR